MSGPDHLSLIRRSLLSMDRMQARIRELEQGTREPIAIIGAGCRFPGGANDPESYWRILRNGVDAVAEVPSSRWNIDDFYDPNPSVAGKMNSRHGGFLQDVDQFDPSFFGIAPREAASMDPQQRILLEVSWEALEHAAQAPDKLDGSPTGVFVGISNSDYFQLVQDPASIDLYMSTGSALSVAAGRLSYILGLQGPSMAVDTACSSSLVAVHLACQSLYSRECRMALAGGVNLVLSPKSTIAISELRMLSPDGRCKTFDASADGFVRGEGCGVVVLKRLSDAIEDGDNVRALILGSAVNQDGRSSGLTAPNGRAQEAVIRKALAAASADPAELHYVEAHGTGTPLGDPIEVRAIASVFGEGRSDGDLLVIGSVKTNFGHLEAAAGIAGLIKVVLALEHEEIPPHLHVEKLNPYVPWHEMPLRVGTTATPWPRGPKRRCAGVSSFGFSGTNAHIVLAEAGGSRRAAPEAERPAHLLCLSARTETALMEQARRLERHLQSHAEDLLADVAFTVNSGRAHFSHRLAVVAGSVDEAREKLSAFTMGNSATDVFNGKTSSAGPSPKVTFLFSGYGSEYVGMGRQIYETEPVFREALTRCDEILRSYLPVPLLEAFYPAPGAASPLHQIDYGMPALFSLEYALARLWQSWGIEPAAVLGAGSGEYAAACIAGAFTLEDGLKLVVAQGRLMRTAGVDKGKAMILTVHSPHHSLSTPVMEPVLEDFRKVALEVSYAAPEIRIISSVTGKSMEPGQVPDTDYWCRHGVADSDFNACLQTARALGAGIFLEIGAEDDALGLPSIRKGHANVDGRQMLASLGALYVSGKNINWRGLDWGYRRRLSLPTYPFERERYWLPAALPELRSSIAAAADSGHPLLGRRIRSSHWETVFETRFNSASILGDHQIDGAALVPSAAFLEMALAASGAIIGTLNPAGSIVSEMELVSPLFLPAHDVGPTVQITLGRRNEESFSFEIASRSASQTAGKLTVHARGLIQRQQSLDGIGTRLSLDELRSRCHDEISRADYYRQLSEVGLQYGPGFQGIQSLWRGRGEAVGRVQLPENLVADQTAYAFHPVLVDSCLQVIGAALSNGKGRKSDLLVPVFIGQVRVFSPLPSAVWSHAWLHPAAGTLSRADVCLFDEAGKVVAEISDVHLQVMPASSRPKSFEDPGSEWVFELAWQPQTIRSIPSPRAIAERLETRVPALTAQEGLAAYRDLEPRLNGLSTAYVLKAMRELGWELRPQSRIPVDSLADKLGVVPRHRRLFSRMLEILKEDGIVDMEASFCTVRRVPNLDEPEQLCEAVLARHPAFAAELSLLGQCGSRLAQVLSGRTDALEVLFPAGSAANVERLYQESPAARVFNALVAEAIQAAVERQPSGRTIRILEIGAGTGGTTSGVLPMLPESGLEYVFTDLSPLFTARAKSKYRAFPFVRCEALDIERDPVAQGLKAHSFDVILAANVLHATKNLRETLRHVKQLLASDGLAVLLEVTKPQRALDLVFGLTEGWWKFADHDLRPEHALLSRGRWQEVLEESGFTEVAVAPHSAAGSAEYNQGVLLAQGPRLSEAGEPTAPSLQAGPWIVFADDGGVAARLGDLLTARGEPCIFVHAGTVWDRRGKDHFQVRPGRLEDLQELFKSALAPGDLSCRGIIHMWSLDALPADETTDASLDADETRGCLSVLRLVQAVSNFRWKGFPRLCLVTRETQPVPSAFVSKGVSQSPLWGVGRVIFHEHPELRCMMVDLSADPSSTEISSLFETLSSSSHENQIALRGSDRYVARLSRLPLEMALPSPPPIGVEGKKLFVPESGNHRLETSDPGILDNVELKAVPRTAPGPGEIQIQVSAAGLNFRDVMKAMGLYPGVEQGPICFGDECSGKVVAVGEGVSEFHAGDEVVAIAPAAFSAFATTRSHLVAPKPRWLSFEEAATIPIAFVTACYALHHLARLSSGERVLIHAASGGVGLAAIQVARAAGAEIYATAGSNEKRDFLRSMGIEHVMDSRSLAFADEVLERTNGSGVDVVLNSLSGEAILKGLSILAPYGRFLEIGKRDIFADARIGLGVFQKCQSFFAIDMERICRERTADVRNVLQEVIALFNDGTFRPLPLQAFPLVDAGTAFRRMALAKHIGKIVLTSVEKDPAPPVQSKAPEATAGLIRSDGTYLITGGLGGLGLLAADWLAQRGARYLVLAGRSGASSEPLEKLRAILPADAQIVVERGDVSRRDDVVRILERIRSSMPPLRGVIHCAGVLDDGLILQLNEQRFNAVMKPKVQGAWNLHTLTSGLPLDFFVLFSSAASVLGSPGQSNHAAANAFLDHLAHFRRSRGLPALSINWGPWSETGSAARPDRAGRLMLRGVKSIPSKEGLALLESLMRRGSVQAVVIPVDWSRWRELYPDLHRWPLVAALSHRETAASQPSSSGKKPALVRDALLALEPQARLRELRCYLSDQIAEVLERPAASLDTEESLNNFGLDSIMALELKNRMETGLGLTISMAQFLQGCSIDQLASELLEQISSSTRAPVAPLAYAAAAGGSGSTSTSIRERASGGNADLDRVRETVDQLSETEVDSMLSELLADQEGNR